MPSVIFRADASPTIGGGHVMRCLTLADRLKEEGWDTSFYCSEETHATVPLLAQGAHRIVESCENEIGETDWLVIDHYGLGVEYEKRCRPRVGKILVLDDMPTCTHDCDILLDQNLDRNPEDYNGLVPVGATVATGTTFALLRPQFAHARSAAVSRPRSVARPFRLLITMGLTDPDNATSFILGTLIKIAPEVAVAIVLGSNAPHLGDVRRQAEDLPFEVTVHTDVTDMAELLADTDLAIGAGGSSAWERCCMGVPTLMVVLAENQRRVAEALDVGGAAISLGSLSELAPQSLMQIIHETLGDTEKRESLSKNSARLCDGLGAGRVSLLLDPELARDGEPVTLRVANKKDGEILLQWQSIAETRRYSRNPESPSRDEHFCWFESKLADPAVLFHMIEHNAKLAGMIRLDPVEGKSRTLEVSILTAPDKYGLGIGRAALQAVYRLLPNSTFLAEVHPENTASQMLFEGAGFAFEHNHYIRQPKAT